MEDKQSRETFSHISDEELQFTKENRQKVFKQIQMEDRGFNMQTKTPNMIQKLMPAAVSILIVGLCLFLFLPSIFSGGLTKEPNHIALNEETNTSNVKGSSIQGDKFSTTLITVKSEEMDNRIYLNLVITFNKEQKLMKVVSLPAETYAPISSKNDGTILYDKLLFAYQFGGAEHVKNTVSKLLDLPIDHYSVVDIKTLSKLLESGNGIEYELPEDMRVRGITQAAFEFEKGKQSFNGEEVITLLMAATTGTSFHEENLVNVLQAIVNKMETEELRAQLKEVTAQIEANTSLDSLLEESIEINEIDFVSLSEGMQTDATTISETEGQFYYQFDQAFINKVIEDLTTFK